MVDAYVSLHFASDETGPPFLAIPRTPSIVKRRNNFLQASQFPIEVLTIRLLVFPALRPRTSVQVNGLAVRDGIQEFVMHDFLGRIGG